MRRRDFLKMSLIGASSALVFCPRVLLAMADTNRRFVLVLQRGAADGLDILMPVGDPHFTRLRGEEIAAKSLALDGQFALHGSMNGLASRFGRGEALFFHAVSSPYRGRSHFDGQNVLETGALEPYAFRDGWLNRFMTLLPGGSASPFSYGTTIPQVLRGHEVVGSFSPTKHGFDDEDLIERANLMFGDDEELARVWNEAQMMRKVSGGLSAGGNGAAIGGNVGRILAQASGPRIAVIETNGWDTHQRQTARLDKLLGGMDELIDGLATSLGGAWAETTVLVATEFGRTAARNGTAGTDHGTAAAAMLVGGLVNGGRVVADWPGLSPNALFEGRDLAPTLDLDSLIASALSGTFEVDPDRVAHTLFPNRTWRRVVEGAIRS